MPTARDYSLIGSEAQIAVENGLAAAAWYHTDIPRKEMKELMKRSDQPALRDTALWFGLLFVTALGAVLLWGSWWCLPFFLAYGVLYGSASDARWHEHGHGTAFKTAWMNDAIYWMASFMILRNPVVWRWSHARHHTDTIVVGRDPEIAVPRPPSPLEVASRFTGLPQVRAALPRFMLQASGRMDPQEATFVPESEWPRVTLAARIFLALYAAPILVSLVAGSWLPLLLFGLAPSIYGAWFYVFTGLTQHAGLAEDVLDHRLNSRTVYMNPMFRFLYLNMNYHVEHHMFPMVPYHRLPELHARMKDDCPTPYPSTIAAYREIIPAIIRQSREPTWYVRRALPQGAKPYRPDLHGAETAAATAAE